MNLTEQLELLERLNNFMNEFGSTQAFICSKTKIIRSELCRFRQRTVVLSPMHVQRLDQFLKSRGY